MFEFEIMVTGYSIAVAAVSITIYRFVSKKQLNKINSELSAIKKGLENVEAEIKKLKMDFDKKQNNKSGS